MTLFAWVYVAWPHVDHRVGRGRLLAVVDDGVRPEVVDDGFDERVVGQVSDMQLDLVFRDLAPGADAFVQRRDVKEGPDAQLELPLALGEVVHDSHSMACPRERHRRRPAEIAVTAEHEDSLSHVQLPSRKFAGSTPRPGHRGSAGVYHRTAAAEPGWPG